MANTIIGLGVALRRGDGGGPEVFTKIAQLTAVNWGGRALDPVDSTTMDVTDGYRTFIGGLLNGGQLSIEGVYDEADAGHAGLQSDMDAKTVRNFELALPAPVSKTFTIAALITSLDKNAPLDGLVTFSATMQVSGKPTVA